MSKKQMVEKEAMDDVEEMVYAEPTLNMISKYAIFASYPWTILSAPGTAVAGIINAINLLILWLNEVLMLYYLLLEPSTLTDEYGLDQDSLFIDFILYPVRKVFVHYICMVVGGVTGSVPIVGFLINLGIMGVDYVNLWMLE